MDSIAGFLEQLTGGRSVDLPRTLWGTVRLDISHGSETDRWFVTAEQSRVFASRSERPADLVLYADRGLFNRFARGEANIVAAGLRNDLAAEGSLRLAFMLRRVFPGPPGARFPDQVAPDRTPPS
jgi:SCP-2 sterol transfer family